MSDQQHHPTADELIGLINGNLDQTRAALVASHLDECSECIEAIDQLDSPRDSVLKKVGHPEAAFEFVEETVFAKAQADVCNLARDASNSRSAEETSAPDPLTVTANWEGSLSEDTEPWHTLKATPSPSDAQGRSQQPTVMLRQRSVLSKKESEGRSSHNTVADADYHVQDLLGVGSMGAVYAARQQSMDRPVAIKVLKPDSAGSERSRQAFVSEAIITGRLDHPNIVPIYDVGKQSDDALFYSMKQVEGVEWKSRFAENTVAENLEILMRVSDAIAFAHARNIIHRDLKPANIMLGPFGEVLVMDWGLAIPTQDHPQHDSFPTPGLGGTPAYMSPEMVNDVSDIDIRSDVYLLGAILFEIITGKPPHTLRSPPEDKRQRVMAYFEAAASNEIAPTEEVGELLDIARKALATKPADRYQTVPEFQAALRDYLAHEENIELASVSSQRLKDAQQSGAYEEFSRARFGFETALQQWPENERAKFGLKQTRLAYASLAFERGDLDLASSLLDANEPEHAALGLSIGRAIIERESRQKQVRRLRLASLAAVIAVAIVASVAAVWINSERGKAIAAQQDEAAQRVIAQRNEKDAIQQRAKATAAELVAKQEAENALRNLKVAEQNAYFSDMVVATQSWEDANIGGLHEIVDRYRDREDLQGFEWHLWNRLARSAQLDLHIPQANRLVFSPDGTRIACSSYAWKIHLLDVATGKETKTIRGHQGGVLDLAYHPDGTQLASASTDKTVRTWNAMTGKPLQTVTGHDVPVTQVLFSLDGKQLFSGDRGGTLKIWDAISGEETHTFKANDTQIRDLALNPEGKLLASVSNDNSAKLWELVTGKNTRILKGLVHSARSVQFDRSGKQLFLSDSGFVKIIDLNAGKEVRRIDAHDAVLNRISLDSTGTRLATAGQDNVVKIWSLPSFKSVLTLRGHEYRGIDLKWSPDSSRVASLSFHGHLKVWDIGLPQSPMQLIPKQQLPNAKMKTAFSPDGSRIASSGGSEGDVLIWDTSTGLVSQTLHGHSDLVNCVAFRPDGKRLASASYDKTIKIWDAATGHEIRTLRGHSQRVTHLSFSPDGRRLAMISADRTTKIWDPATGREALTLASGGYDPGVSFSPDGTRLAATTMDRSIGVWDTRPWTPKRRAEVQARSYLSVRRKRVKSLEELRQSIRNDKTINDLVRQQCLDWAEPFWNDLSAKN